MSWLKERTQQVNNGYVRRFAIEALAQGWADDPDTLPILKYSAEHDNYWYVRSAAIEFLDRGSKDDTDIVSIFKKSQPTRSKFNC
ncbi:MAG: HEAT repeat domain-containing protein [Chamaesiphon sp. CSU_1_12]|nr:HEAT repeat domain-containing protein [Chamaesiphon sp. CSU_1_12]